MPETNTLEPVLEVAVLDVKSGMTAEFEAAFFEAQNIISSIDGYIDHELQRCFELERRYILLVRWHSLEAHTVGFRQSEQYQQWRKLLHHYYSPFPSVEHYQKITACSSA